MYLTYNKSLPAFYQEMVQLEMDAPDASKVYVEFHEGFVPLAAKYYEALASHVDVPSVNGIPVPSPAPVVEPVVAPVEDPEPVKAPADAAAVSQVSDPVAPADAAVDAPVVKKSRKQSV